MPGNKTIPQLPPVTVPSDTDLVPVSQGGVTMKATLGQIVSGVTVDLTSAANAIHHDPATLLTLPEAMAIVGQNIFSVAAYGAIGAGADESTQIANAIAAAGVDGYILFEPQKTYYLGGTALTLLRGQKIIGNGATISQDSGVRCLNLASNVLLEDIEFDGNDDWTPVAVGHFCYGNKVQGVTFRRCAFQDTGNRPIAFGGATNVRVENCTFRRLRQTNGMCGISGAYSWDGNEILNGGFETPGSGGADVFADWDETAGDGAIADEGVLVHSGAHAAKLTAGASVNTVLTQTIAVADLLNYCLTFYTRGDGTYDGRWAVYDVTHSEYIHAVTATGITGTDYAKVQIRVPIPEGCASVRVELWCPGTDTGVAYFDDVYFVCVTAGLTVEGNVFITEHVDPADTPNAGQGEGVCGVLLLGNNYYAGAGYFESTIYDITIRNNYFERMGRYNTTGTAGPRGDIDLYNDLDGLIIEGNTSRDCFYSCVKINDARNVRISKNTIIDPKGYGIVFLSRYQLMRNENINISDNIIVGSYLRPIRLDGKDGDATMYLKHVEVCDNILDASKSGYCPLSIYDVSDFLVTGNILWGIGDADTAAITMSNASMAPQPPVLGLIANNTIDCLGANKRGITINMRSTNRGISIIGNTIVNCGTAAPIAVLNTNNVQVGGNLFDPGVELVLTGSAGTGVSGMFYTGATAGVPVAASYQAGDIVRQTDGSVWIKNSAGVFRQLEAATNNPVRGIFTKNFEDNVAETIFSIMTTDETGDNDAGGYACFVRALIQHGVGSTAGTMATKAFEACYCRAKRATGTGVSSVVLETAESASATTNSAARDIAAVTMTTVETTEYQDDIQFTVDLTGTGVTTGTAVVEVTVVWWTFLTAPTLVAA